MTGDIRLHLIDGGKGRIVRVIQTLRARLVLRRAGRGEGGKGKKAKRRKLTGKNGKCRDRSISEVRVKTRAGAALRMKHWLGAEFQAVIRQGLFYH
jgi:hypothetical protein